MCDDYEGAMACDDTCFYVHVQQHEEGTSQRSVSAEVWTVKVVVCVLYVCPPRSTRQSGEVVARGFRPGVDPGYGDSEPGTVACSSVVR